MNKKEQIQSIADSKERRIRVDDSTQKFTETMGFSQEINETVIIDLTRGQESSRSITPNLGVPLFLTDDAEESDERAQRKRDPKKHRKDRSTEMKPRDNNPSEAIASSSSISVLEDFRRSIILDYETQSGVYLSQNRNEQRNSTYAFKRGRNKEGTLPGDIGSKESFYYSLIPSSNISRSTLQSQLEENEKYFDKHPSLSDVINSVIRQNHQIPSASEISGSSRRKEESRYSPMSTQRRSEPSISLQKKKDPPAKRQRYLLRDVLVPTLPQSTLSKYVPSKESNAKGGRGPITPLTSIADELLTHLKANSIRWKPANPIKAVYRNMGLLLSDDEISDDGGKRSRVSVESPEARKVKPKKRRVYSSGVHERHKDTLVRVTSSSNGTSETVPPTPALAEEDTSPQNNQSSIIAQCPVYPTEPDSFLDDSHLSLSINAETNLCLPVSNITGFGNSVELTSPDIVSSHDVSSVKVLPSSAKSAKQNESTGIDILTTTQSVITTVLPPLAADKSSSKSTGAESNSIGKAELGDSHASSPDRDDRITESGSVPLSTATLLTQNEIRENAKVSNPLFPTCSPSSSLSTLTSLSSSFPSEADQAIRKASPKYAKSNAKAVQPMSRCKPTTRKTLSRDEKQELLTRLIEDEKDDINDFCHPCRTRSIYAKMKCTRVTDGVCCRLYFCHRCFLKLFPELEFDPDATSFVCPFCRGTCKCDACCKKRGILYLPRWRSASEMAIVTQGVPLFLSEQEVRHQERRDIANAAGIVMPTKTEQKERRQEPELEHTSGILQDREGLLWISEQLREKRGARVYIGEWDDSWGSWPVETTSISSIEFDVHAQHGAGKGKGRIYDMARGERLYVGEPVNPHRVVYSADEVCFPPIPNTHGASKNKKKKNVTKNAWNSDYILSNQETDVNISDEPRKRPRRMVGRRKINGSSLLTRTPDFTINYESNPMDRAQYQDVPSAGYGTPSSFSHSGPEFDNIPSLCLHEEITSGSEATNPLKRYSNHDPFLGSLGPADDLLGGAWGYQSSTTATSNTSSETMPLSNTDPHRNHNHNFLLPLPQEDPQESLMDFNIEPDTMFYPFHEEEQDNYGNGMTNDVSPENVHNNASNLEKPIIDPSLDTAISLSMEISTGISVSEPNFLGLGGESSIFGEPSSTGLSLTDLTRTVCVSLSAAGLDTLDRASSSVEVEGMEGIEI